MASAADEKLKQEEQTQVAEALQAMSVVHKIQLEVVPEHS